MQLSSQFLIASSGVAACDAVTRTDSRYSTPERTIATLFASHGLTRLTQAEVRARIGEQGTFRLVDRDAWEGCFADLRQPGGEGLAGYVLGLLAAAKDELGIQLFESRATVTVHRGGDRAEPIRVVMERDATGAYRISLRQSVPPEVRRAIVQVEDNARHRVPVSDSPSRR